ncbi:MAG: PAS domain-containing protein [Alphaproteobacteria bacterium]
MSPLPPRLLLLAPPARRRELERRLHAAATPVAIATATPATAREALADGPPDLVVFAPAHPPTSASTQELVQACAPAPVVVVWPDDAGPTPGELAEVAACLPGATDLAETVSTLLARRAGAGGSALKDILGQVNEPLLLIGADGLVIAANAPFAELSGWSDARLVGRPFATIVPQWVAERVTTSDRHDWSADAVPMRAPPGTPPVAADLRASIVHLAGGRAPWLLRFRRAHAPRLPASPEAAARAIDALGRRARAAGNRVAGANVRLIGLGRARESLGERWPRFQRHIALVCESTIAHELGAHDVAIATKTGDYLVCFACDDEEAADRRADRLQATIDRRLFGEEGSGLQATTGGREALDAMSVEVEAAVLPADAAEAPAHIADRFARACANRRRNRLAEFNRRLDDLDSSGDLELLAMATPRGVLPSLVRAHWFPAEHARLHRLAERANQLDELKLALDLRRLALVDTAESDGVLDDALAIVDLHITTIERRKSWDALLPMIQDLAGSTRRWLVPNLVGIPPDVYPGRLRDAVVTLKPFSRIQTMTLSAHQLASLDLNDLRCRLFVITAAEAASALDSDLPRRVRERLDLARAKLAVDGGSPRLAAAFGATLRTLRDGAPAPAA